MKKFLILIVLPFFTLSAQDKDPFLNYVETEKQTYLDQIEKYYDSIKVNLNHPPRHCYKYCIKVHIFNDTLIVGGKNLHISELDSALDQFLKNPLAFTTGNKNDSDFQFKGNIELYYNQNTQNTGRQVLSITLKALSKYYRNVSIHGQNLNEYIKSHLKVDADFHPPPPSKIPLNLKEE